MAEEPNVQAEGSQESVAGSATEGSGSQNEKGLIGSLAAPLKGEERLAGFSNASELATKYLEALDASEDRNFIPGDDADESVVEDFYKQLGVPEKADEYEYDTPEGLPDALWTEDSDKAFRDVAKKLHMTADQVKGLMGWYLTSLKTGYDRQVGQATQDIEKQMIELRNMWGDSYDRNSEIGGRAMERYQPEDTAALAEVLGPLVEHPVVKMFMYNVGIRTVEDTLLEPKGGIEGEQIEEIETDGSFDYSSM